MPRETAGSFCSKEAGTTSTQAASRTAGGDLAAATELARRTAANSPVAVANARHALRRGLDVDLAAGLDIEDSAWRATVFSDDRREGVRAFLEHRDPDWP